MAVHRILTPALRAAVLGALLLTSEAAGQSRNALCSTQLQRLAPGVTGGADPCQDLAAAVVAPRQEKVILAALASALETLPERDFQSRATSQPATAGAVGQGDAAATVQPLAIAGGSVAAVGSEGGNNAVTALTLNPAIFWRPSRSQIERANDARISDLTILLPLSRLDADGDGDVDYFGARLRLNLLGRLELEELNQQVGNLAQYTTDVIDALAAQFRETARLRECVDAYGSDAAAERIIQACGQVSAVAFEPANLDRFRGAISQVRAQADARYLGVDARFDRGDPSLGATPGMAGSALFLGLAYGSRTDPELNPAAGFGYHLRAGIINVVRDDATLPDSVRAKASLDAALALDYTYPSTFQPLKASLGLEFRRGDAPAIAAKELRTDYLTYRLSLDIPITAGNTIAVSFAKPVMGEGKPTLSLNANWQLLASSLMAGVTPR